MAVRGRAFLSEHADHNRSRYNKGGLAAGVTRRIGERDGEIRFHFFGNSRRFHGRMTQCNDIDVASMIQSTLSKKIEMTNQAVDPRVPGISSGDFSTARIANSSARNSRLISDAGIGCAASVLRA
jgi:hypothetical protein